MANAWALDKDTHDMFLDGEEIGRYAGVDEVAQHIKQRLLFFFEEWFLDRDAGVPWFQEIFVKPERKALVDARLKKEITDTEGVDELLFFDSVIDFERRSYDLIKFTVRTQYGLLEETL